MHFHYPHAEMKVVCDEVMEKNHKSFSHSSTEVFLSLNLTNNFQLFIELFHQITPVISFSSLQTPNIKLNV